MNPATHIIKKLGGPSAVAAVLGVAYTGPYRWQQAGYIPYKYIDALLEHARTIGVELTRAEFVEVREPSES